jgi:hypothetical protein
MSSKPTLYRILVSTSLSLHMPQLFHHQRPSMRSTRFKRSPCLASRSITRWLSVTHRTESTWLLACCTVEMLSPRMFITRSPLLRLNERFSSSIGAQLASRLVSASSHLKKFLVVTWPKLSVLCKYTFAPVF